MESRFASRSPFPLGRRGERGRLIARRAPAVGGATVPSPTADWSSEREAACGDDESSDVRIDACFTHHIRAHFMNTVRLHGLYGAMQRCRPTGDVTSWKGQEGAERSAVTLSPKFWAVGKLSENDLKIFYLSKTLSPEMRKFGMKTHFGET